MPVGGVADSRLIHVNHIHWKNPRPIVYIVKLKNKKINSQPAFFNK